MKLDVILESDDRIAMMKQMQNKKYSGIRDSLDRKDISTLIHIVKQKDRKKNPLKGVDEETIDSLQAAGLLANDGSPTGLAKSFLNWVRDNPNREMDYHDKRADADDALKRGQLKRDNDWVDPRQKRARKIIRNLSDEEKESFERIYNRYLNARTKNLSKNWGDARSEDIQLMRSKGMLDDANELTDLGEFTLNYYTAFKNDPDGLDRVSKGKRVGNYGDARRRRQGRLKRSI